MNQPFTDLGLWQTLLRAQADGFITIDEVIEAYEKFRARDWQAVERKK